ncbi:MAG: cell division protein FtsZ [Lentimicrobiaceae bacterium]|nr:cell division protein FtsZ [Lentimicrobiaceae bacterium]
MLKFDSPKDQNSIIKVIGVGGGGSNAVNHMFTQGIKGVDFIICNTDGQSLETSPIPVKMQIGSTGLGAGNDPVVGRNAALESADQIHHALERNTKMVFITAGMGGGTGTGAAPVIASIARELNILTIGIVTLPFSFEGRKRKQQAEDGIQDLRKYCDSILIICNDRLRELYGNLPFSEAFAQADNVLAIGAKGIAELITVVGHVNVDFEDVKTVMKDSGKAIMGSGNGEGENRAIDAIQAAMASPLLDDYDIRGAANILLYIASGTDEIKMDELSDINEYVQNKAGSKADIIWGYRKDETLEKKISITLIATGFDSIRRNQQEMETQKTIYSLYDTPNPVPEPPKQEISDEIKIVENFETTPVAPPAPVIEFRENNPPEKTVYSLDSCAETYQFNESSISKPIEKQAAIQEPVALEFANTENTVAENNLDLDDNDHIAQVRRERLKEMSTKLRNPKIVEEMEAIPAYERRRINISSTTPSSDSHISRFTLTGEKGDMKDENPFFNPQAD